MGKVAVPRGEIDGCLTFEQSESYLRRVAEAYEAVVKLEVVGTSVEGNPLTALCVGYACFDERNVPESFQNGMHHSRECLSMMTLHYGLNAILEGLDSSKPWALHLLETRKIWMLPIVNPDGYLWNERKFPGGFGMQRKNRRQGECPRDKDLGVDLNRNYPVCFDRADNGASTRPCDEDYKGRAPFSEPETQAVKALIERSNFTTALNIHSYGKFVLVPYSCRSAGSPPKEDEPFFVRYANELARANHFTVGRPWDNVVKLYSVNGDAADWMFREHHIFAVSPEVGGGDFWLKGAKTGQAIPYSTENIPMVLHAAWAAGPLVRVEWFNVTVSAAAEGGKPVATLSVEVVNAGIWHSAGAVTVSTRAGGVQARAELGLVPAKFGAAVARLELPLAALLDATSSGVGLLLSVSDGASCGVFAIRDEHVSPLRKPAPAPVNVPMNYTVYQDRFAPDSQVCTFWQRADPVELPPGSENRPPQATSGETDWFSRLSVGLYTSPWLLAVPLVVLSIGCSVCLLRLKKGDDAAYDKIADDAGARVDDEGDDV